MSWLYYKTYKKVRKADRSSSQIEVDRSEWDFANVGVRNYQMILQIQMTMYYDKIQIFDYLSQNFCQFLFKMSMSSNSTLQETLLENNST